MCDLVKRSSHPSVVAQCRLQKSVNLFQRETSKPQINTFLQTLSQMNLQCVVTLVCAQCETQQVSFSEEEHPGEQSLSLITEKSKKTTNRKSKISISQVSSIGNEELVLPSNTIADEKSDDLTCRFVFAHFNLHCQTMGDQYRPAYIGIDPADSGSPVR